MLALATGAPSPTSANEDTIDRSRALFVRLADSPIMPIVDPETDRIAGSLEMGLPARQLELAASIGKLLAIDGDSPAVAIVDVVTGSVNRESLGFVPRRLAVSPDGLTAALADTGNGRIALLDLL